MTQLTMIEGGDDPTDRRLSATERPDRLASYLRFAFSDPGGFGQVRDLREELGACSTTQALHASILDRAMSLTGADYGNVQLFDPSTGALGISSHSGFSDEFLEYFAVVDDDHSACGRAASTGAQTVIVDVDNDSGFAPHRKIAAASGFRAVQSTPLANFDGQLVGMVSTHFAQPHRPSDDELEKLALFGLLAGETVGVSQGAASPPPEPIGRAVLGALFSLGGEDQTPSLPEPVSDSLLDMTSITVNRLFSIALGLADLQGRFGRNDDARVRLGGLIDELDATIREVRLSAFDAMVKREQP